MKNNNMGIALLALLCLTGGYLLIQNPPLSAQEDAVVAQPESQLPTLPVAASWIPVDPAPMEGHQTGDATDAQLKMVSSSDALTLSSAEQVSERYQQHFSVVGLTAKSCDVYVAVFETESGFPKPELSTKTVVVPSTEEQVHFSLDLPHNRPVAIAVFQDIDGNGKLTKNQMGIPREPYGFSNNARGMFGPPAFKQAAFELGPEQESSESIEIKVR